MIKSDFKKKIADSWFSYLQTQICKEFELLENKKIKFSKREWKKKKKREGGGTSMLLKNGRIFEKVGVNKSTVSGIFPKQFRSKILGAKARDDNKLAKKYVSEAKKHINDNNQFYIALEKALHNYIKSKLHIENQELNKPRVQELLSNGAVNSDDIKDFIGLLEQCELARYAPSSTSSSQSNYNRAIEIISKIDKQLR